VILESVETFQVRQSKAVPSAPARKLQAYAEIAGFGASQTVHPASRNLRPDPEGRAIVAAMRTAMREAQVGPDEIDLVIPLGLGVPDYDQAEAAALRTVFGARLASLPVVSLKPLVGNCAAGAGGLDVCVAAKALAEQTVPATINCAQPLDGLHAGTAPARPAKLRYVLTCTTGIGGQNAALVLRRFEP
jgi:3-oxoacyl-[acyl-carrier-protein] synthase II